MKYFSGITVLFVPEPNGSLYAKRSDNTSQIWAAEDYDNDEVSEITQDQADIIKTWPGWEEA